MWNCGGCAHPIVTGFTEQEVLTQKAMSHGIRPDRIQDACISAQLRIENAIILNSYSDWIKSNRLHVGTVNKPEIVALTHKAIARRLLAIISNRISLTDDVLMAMCNKHNWKTFAGQIACKRSWEEVSEIDASFMMRIRASVA